MKAISLTIYGTTVLPRKDARDVPNSFAFDLIQTEPTERGFAVISQQQRLFRSTLRKVCEFPFNGSKVERIDASRNLTSGAIGAVAGGLLLGPLGLVAGGLIGGKKRILYTVTRGADVALLELSPSEEKTLIVRGFSTGGSGFTLGKPSKQKGRPVQRYCVTCGTVVAAHVAGLFGTHGSEDGDATCSICSGRC